METDPDRSSWHYRPGVSDRLHCKSAAWLGCLGLQWYAGQLPGADLPTILCAVAAGGMSRNYFG